MESPLTDLRNEYTQRGLSEEIGLARGRQTETLLNLTGLGD
ncbi:MAG: hypothetical protein NVSMB27_12200 [Ktedonobacteraceae bacterium]